MTQKGSIIGTKLFKVYFSKTGHSDPNGSQLGVPHRVAGERQHQSFSRQLRCVSLIQFDLGHKTIRLFLF